MKNIFILLISLIFLISTSELRSQSKATGEIRIKKSEFKTADKEGFKEAWDYLKEGDINFRGGPGFYPDARELFLKAHQYNSENAELNYLIGYCYLHTDDKYEAIRYLRKAYDLKPDIGHEVHYLLGRAYHLVLEFDKAIGQYDEFIKTLSKDDKEIDSAVNKLITECINGKQIITNRKRVIISNPGDSINSIFDDYSSVFTRNDSAIYFTSRRPGLKAKRNPWDNKFYENAWVSELHDGKWSGARLVNPDFSHSENYAVVGIAPEGTGLYIYHGNKDGGNIYLSGFKKGEWKEPEPVPSALNSKQVETTVFLSVTGDTIYFISANEDLTRGGRDILRSVKNEKGKWQKPVNLSSRLNTRYDEEGLFITPDGKDIYFSSKGHNSMGGYDIFHSRLMEDGWSDPENLGYPVNTPDDDLFFSLSSDGKHGYYSTIREGGTGGRDIFKVTFLGEEKEMLLRKEPMIIGCLTDTIRKSFFSVPEALGIDTFYYLAGTVLDKKSNQPVTARIEIIDVGESKVVATGMTTEGGKFNIKLNTPKNYGIEITSRDYLFFLDAVDMTNSLPDEPFVKDFFLEKIEVGTKVVLENIYFETSKAVLQNTSFPQLNMVLEFLRNNESVKLEISGHTDNVGSAKVNNKLSEDRAKAVVSYLVANGTASERLVAKGYGFSQPVALNDTPDGREKNRRVEFKVLSK